MAHRVLSPINDLWKTKNARKFPVAVVGLLLEASGSGKTDKTDNTNPNPNRTTFVLSGFIEVLFLVDVVDSIGWVDRCRRRL